MKPITKQERETYTRYLIRVVDNRPLPEVQRIGQATAECLRDRVRFLEMIEEGRVW